MHGAAYHCLELSGIVWKGDNTMKLSRKLPKRLTALSLAAMLLLGVVPAQAADTQELTRGEAAQALLEAGDEYVPDLELSDIIKGYPNGSLDLDSPVTRAQALVMLERAFGGLPAPEGDNALTAFPSENFTDIPAWALEELAGVLSAGIVAGTGEGTMAPDHAITAGELNAFIHRAYALKGTCEQDDFYATVNKEWLDNATLPAGLSINGPFYGLSLTVNQQVARLIRDIDAKTPKAGTAEAKIKALYDCVMDTEGREQAGVTPIQKYLDAIENAKSVKELMDADALMEEELGISTLLGFGLTTDLVDSTHYIVTFSAAEATLDKDFYANGTQAQKDAYLDYRTAFFTLSGLDGETAKAMAQTLYDTEKVISAASLDPQDAANVDKIYNLYTMDELQKIFPNVDLKMAYPKGLKAADKILVVDPGALKAAAVFFDDEHLETLKVVARAGLLGAVASSLSQKFQDAAFDFNEAYYGIDARQSTEEIAALQVQSLLADYLSRAYVESYFSAEAKADVEEMIKEFIGIYKERIQALDWMSDATKEKAVKKLDTMQIKVGYPDNWETYLDNAIIQSPAEGGTFFSNIIAIQMAARNYAYALQNEPVDKSQWAMSPFTVNACYNPTANDITFPAAILQAPLYDVDASREENLGGIGFIIAHEITHAFDNNGAKFDEKGNSADWWTESDYTAFQAKCKDVVAWYDGQEAYPGIACSGMLTLSENVADLGSIQCVISAVKKRDDPDYDALFRALANTWASTTTRQMREYLAAADVHAPDKLRCNRVLQTVAEFYEAYDIQPGDGMWTDPDSRVTVW